MTNIDRILAYVVILALGAMFFFDFIFPYLLDIFNKFCHQDAQHWFGK